MKKSYLACCVFILGSLLFSPVQTFSKEVIPFGLCSKYNPRIMYQLYQPFVDYLSKNTPYQFEISLSKTYEETIARFGQRNFTLASCGPVPYIKAREKYNVRPILRALSKGGKTTYHGIIIVRQDSPIQKIVDLKGKSFAFAQEWSTAGHILPQYHLAKAKVRLEDLKSYTFLRHHDSVVQGILKRQIDAGAVKDIVAYHYQSQGIKFILVTDPTPTVPIVVRNDTPKGIVESVRAALLKLNPDNPIDQKVMSLWDEEFKYGFTEASDSDYDPIRKILREVLEGQETRGRSQAR